MASVQLWRAQATLKRCLPTALDFLLRSRYAGLNIVWQWVTWGLVSETVTNILDYFLDEEKEQEQEDIYIWFQGYHLSALRCRQGTNNLFWKIFSST
jgi:hypothetical protein